MAHDDRQRKIAEANEEKVVDSTVPDAAYQRTVAQYLFRPATRSTKSNEFKNAFMQVDPAFISRVKTEISPDEWFGIHPTLRTNVFNELVPISTKSDLSTALAPGSLLNDVMEVMEGVGIQRSEFFETRGLKRGAQGLLGGRPAKTIDHTNVVFQPYERQIAELKKRIDEMRQEQVEYTNTIAVLQTNASHDALTVASLQKQLQESKEFTKILEKELQHETDRYKLLKDQYENSYAQAQKDIQDGKKKQQELEEEIQSIKNLADDLSKNAENALKEYRSQEKSANFKMAEMKKIIGENEESLLQLRGQYARSINKLNQEKAELEQEIAKVKNLLDSASVDVSSHVSTVSRLEKKNMDLKTELDDLKTENKRLSELEEKVYLLQRSLLAVESNNRLDPLNMPLGNSVIAITQTKRKRPGSISSGGASAGSFAGGSAAGGSAAGGSVAGGSVAGGSAGAVIAPISSPVGDNISGNASDDSSTSYSASIHVSDTEEEKFALQAENLAKNVIAYFKNADSYRALMNSITHKSNERDDAYLNISRRGFGEFTTKETYIAGFRQVMKDYAFLNSEIAIFDILQKNGDVTIPASYKTQMRSVRKNFDNITAIRGAGMHQAPMLSTHPEWKNVNTDALDEYKIEGETRNVIIRAMLSSESKYDVFTERDVRTWRNIYYLLANDSSTAKKSGKDQLIFFNELSKKLGLSREFHENVQESLYDPSKKSKKTKR